MGPLEVRNVGRKRLFEKKYYDQLFTEKRTVFEYLLFFWLNEIVSNESRGNYQRSYAKWVVVNLLYNAIKDNINNKTSRRKFIHICERYYVLNKAANQLFYSVLAFYNANKKISKGLEIDVSNSFKSARVEGFEKYWKSRNNSYRRNLVIKYIKTSLKEIEAIEL